MIPLGARKGRPPIGLDKLVGMQKRCEDARWAAFFDQAKLAVSEEEALDAAKALSEARGKKLKRYGVGAAIGVTSYPAVAALGEGVKGFVAAPKGKRLQGALQGARKSIAAPELAKNVTRGGFGATAVQALRENVQLQDAKKTYRAFLKEQGAE